MLNVDFKNKYELSEDEQNFNLILISGVYDLRPLIQTEINDALKLNTNTAAIYSPLLFNSLKIPFIKKMKVLMAYGEHESPAFKDQTDSFASVSILFIKNYLIQNLI